MAAETRSTWGAAVKGVSVKFAEFFDQNVDVYRATLEPLAMMGTDDGEAMHVSGKTGAGRLKTFDEGDTIPSLNRYKLYTTRYTHTNYGGIIEITKNALMDREFDEEFDEFKDLVLSGNISKEHAFFQVFNAAFGTSASVNGVPISRYQDGKPLCSTAHPRVDGGTAQSNASSTGIPLTPDNLETAEVAASNQLLDDGNPVALNGRITLVVPKNLERLAVQMTESVLDAETANNNVNVYRGRIDVVVAKWLNAANGGSDKAWFLVVAGQAKLRFILRQDLETDRDVDFNTKTVKFSVDARWSVGHNDWHFVWGSKGDSAAYSS